MSTKQNPLSEVLCGLAIAIIGVSAADGCQGASWADEAQRFQTSERAISYLVGVAELNTGVTVISFDIDKDVGCRTNYGSSVCPIPGSTRLAALRAAGRGDVEPEIRRLQPVADADGNGFVSDDEGKTFGTLVHFGQELNFLVTSARRTTDEIAHLMGLSSTEFQIRLRDYRVLVVRASQVGVTFVASPSIELLAQSSPPN